MRRSRLKRTPFKQGAGKGLAPGKPLERRTALARTGIKRGRWTRADWEVWNRLDVQAHAIWKGSICRRRCEMCLRSGRARDAHATRDAHHILPARYIRGYVRSLKLPAAEARVLLRSLLWDRRNGMSLCRSCHDNHESAFRRVPRVAIPMKARQFARELEMEYVIDRLYPA